MPGVADPALHRGVDLGEVDKAPGVGAGEAAQAAAEAVAVVVAQAPVVGKHQIAEEVQSVPRRADVGLARMQPQAVRGQPVLYRHPNLGAAALVVVEGDHVLDVAQIGLDPKLLLHEVVQAVEIEVGQELAGQVADPERTRPAGGGTLPLVTRGGVVALAAGRIPDPPDHCISNRPFYSCALGPTDARPDPHASPYGRADVP